MIISTQSEINLGVELERTPNFRILRNYTQKPLPFTELRSTFEQSIRQLILQYVSETSKHTTTFNRPLISHTVSFQRGSGVLAQEAQLKWVRKVPYHAAYHWETLTLICAYGRRSRVNNTLIYAPYNPQLDKVSRFWDLVEAWHKTGELP